MKKQESTQIYACRCAAAAFACLCILIGQVGAREEEKLPYKLSTTLNIDGEPFQIALADLIYKGVRLTHVGRKGIAAAAGIEVGDVLLSLNGQLLENPLQADEVLNIQPSGQLEIVYARKTSNQYRIHETAIMFSNPFKSPFRAGTQLALNTSPSEEHLETALFQLLNTDRKEYRLSPLIRSSHLDEQARNLARAEARRPEPLKRSSDKSVNKINGVRSVEEAENLFMDRGFQPASTRNILNPDYTMVGLSVLKLSDGTYLVVQKFARCLPKK